MALIIPNNDPSRDPDLGRPMPWVPEDAAFEELVQYYQTTYQPQIRVQWADGILTVEKLREDIAAKASLLKPEFRSHGK